MGEINIKVAIAADGCGNTNDEAFVHRARCGEDVDVVQRCRDAAFDGDIEQALLTATNAVRRTDFGEIQPHFDLCCSRNGEVPFHFG